MFATLLALCAAAGIGTADFLAGLSAKRLSTVTVTFASNAVGLAVIATLFALNPHAPSVRALAFGLLAGMISVVGLVAFYKGLAIGPMGVVASLAALSGAIPLAVGLLRGERPTFIQLAGIALAMSGAVFATRASGEDQAHVSSRALWFAGIAVITFGTALVLLNEAGRTDPLAAVVSVHCGAVLLAGGAALVRRESFSMDGRQAFTLVAIGVLGAVSVLLFVLAAERGLLSLIAVLFSMYPVVTILLARGVLRERLSRRQMVGVAATLTGVAMIATG